jgi:hypothetical protein
LIRSRLLPAIYPLPPALPPTAEGAEADAGSADLETRLRRQFSLLPDPSTVKVEGEEVIVEFPEETAGFKY